MRWLFEGFLLIGKLICIGTIFTHLLAIIIYKWKERKIRRQIKVEGFIHPDFKPVMEAFKKNLHKGWERDGAAFAVYYKDRLVIDMWGGYADAESLRPWRQETLSIAFSSSKAVGAVCMAILVDRGFVRYEDKVTSFWPQFAKHGKEDITVKMILEHSAGLPLIERKVTIEDAQDHEIMASLFEDQKPLWPPGTRVGYHMLTYGWLVDQIVRRVDSKKRSIGQFFKEEIADPFNIDFHFGLPVELTHRVARITKPSIWNRIEEYIVDPASVDYGNVFRQFLVNGLMFKVANNASWCQSIFRVTLNNPELYQLEQCAALGIGTARAMAKIMKLYIKGEIVSQKMVDLTSQPTIVTTRDQITNAFTDRGYGFTHTRYPFSTSQDAITLVGHAGFGGQNIRFDRNNEIAFAYISNGLKSGMGDRARPYMELLKALYRCIPENNNTLGSESEPSCKSSHSMLKTTKNVMPAFDLNKSPEADIRSTNAHE